MSIRYIEYKDIDKIKWDDCIDRSSNGIIYAYSWYLDIVCNGKWTALVQDDYCAVMPLPLNRKYGIEYLYPPFLAQQLGVFSKETLTQIIVQNFLNAIPAHFKFIEMYLNTAHAFPVAGFQTKRNLTHELDLNYSYDKLYKSFSENSKRNIKKAEKAGVSLSSTNTAEDVIILFKKTKGKEVVNLKNKDYERLQHLISVCRKRGMATVWTVKTNSGELCAGAVFIQSNGKIIYLVSAASEKGKSLGAMAYLVNVFIKENASKNLVLDFEGSNDANLARFYKSFGSKERVYLFIKKNNLPKLIRWIKK